MDECVGVLSISLHRLGADWTVVCSDEACPCRLHKYRELYQKWVTRKKCTFKIFCELRDFHAVDGLHKCSSLSEFHTPDQNQDPGANRYMMSYDGCFPAVKQFFVTCFFPSCEFCWFYKTLVWGQGKRQYQPNFQYINQNYLLWHKFVFNSWCIWLQGWFQK